MQNRQIPFRPKLEGNFRIRFYNAASKIGENTSTLEIVKIAESEIKWVEEDCAYNLEQRKKYRAIWFLFRDLIKASWKACYRDGNVYMSLPNLNGANFSDSTSPEVKALMRSWMSESRHERLINAIDFIRYMENPNAGKKSIEFLIADGQELSERLLLAKENKLTVNKAVQPYLQLVKENEKDEYTGLKLSEIWRYFRLTWSTPAENTPGRTMQYLIRDAAHPMHAVMGIASLENCTVQITCRDNYIGWNQTKYIERIREMKDDEAKVEFNQLIKYLNEGISGIDFSDLCTEAVIANPSDNDIHLLFIEAEDAEKNRQLLLKGESAEDNFTEEKSDLGSISMNTEKALYRRKRAEQLARLLSAKKNIKTLIANDKFNDLWKSFCDSELGQSSIRASLVAQKKKHIGSSMMELNVCGAIPPYNEILGGKLVALLATSPQIIHDYKERYSGKPSEIASRLKGEPVYRPADLVYVGTTSLYYVGSSQYNRLVIPKNVFNSQKDIVWKKIGMTIGFGTMHISKATTLSLTEATSNGYNKINHVFGEGASPKMRLLTMAIRELLESSNEDSKDFSKHAMSRIVYGVCLADNTFDYLMGKDCIPRYYTDLGNYIDGTQKIVDFWTNRWLKSRLNYEPIYERIANFDKKQFLVSNQIANDEEWSFEKLKEATSMPVVKDNNSGLDFVRNFYRGMSAYADWVEKSSLENIHLHTKLDDSIINNIKNGKDIVLTGNPGDGKTHIIRILESELIKINADVVIDASTLSDDEIFREWNNAKETNKPFVMAINAAVLHSVASKYGKTFKPVKDAYEQVLKSIVFSDESICCDDVVVYDLSKRSVLTAEILNQAIKKLTDKKHYVSCASCPLKDTCDVTIARKLLNEKLFQERLLIVVNRVALKGYHATLRELQGFISYLLFGNRQCTEIMSTNNNNEFNIVNLIYSGKGKFFDAIRSSINPILISHPIWDERILLNDYGGTEWVNGYKIPNEAIAADNVSLFELRKKQFFFFNNNGNNLLTVLDDDISKFYEFLSYDDNKMVKDLLGKINKFFQTEGSGNSKNGELRIWTGHRFDNEPRKVLISSGSIPKKKFKIARPNLLSSMHEGFDMTVNYVLLKLNTDDARDSFLKIDFNMYTLLSDAEKGVPVLFIESDLVKKMWRFMEQLQNHNNDDDLISLSLADVKNKKVITVTIDESEKKYAEIR